MKFNKITLALIAAAAAAPMMATAGVTVSPILLGYHWAEGIDDTADDQRKLTNSGIVPGGVAKGDDLYTAAAIGIELTPSTQFQVEYGVSNSDGEQGNGTNDLVDMDQEMITGNFLIGFDQFTGYRDTNFRPYGLIGGGRSKVEIETNRAIPMGNGQIPAGSKIGELKDTIGNLGLGAMYRVNDALSLRGEARGIYNFDEDWWEAAALGGVEVVLGGHLEPAVVAPPIAEPLAVVDEPTRVAPVVVPPIIVVEQDIDSDGDGVIDRLDQCPNTPTNKVVDAVGCPQQVVLDDELKMELRVFFDRDKSVIKDQYRSEIAKVAEKMREYPNSTASVEGHASKNPRSSATYNQRLSEARAIAVKTMLTNQFGIAPNRLRTVGYGFTRPIAPNTTPEGRAMNRRVYAVITGNKTLTVDQTKDMQVQ